MEERDESSMQPMQDDGGNTMDQSCNLIQSTDLQATEAFPVEETGNENPHGSISPIAETGVITSTPKVLKTHLTKVSSSSVYDYTESDSELTDPLCSPVKYEGKRRKSRSFSRELSFDGKEKDAKSSEKDNPEPKEKVEQAPPTETPPKVRKKPGPKPGSKRKKKEQEMDIDLPSTGLPDGWSRKALERKAGATAGKKDVYIFSPEGKKFRSKKDIREYCTKNSIDTAFVDNSMNMNIKPPNSPAPPEPAAIVTDTGQGKPVKKYKTKSKKEKALSEEKQAAAVSQRSRRTSAKRVSSAVIEALQDSDCDLSETEFLKKIQNTETSSSTRKRVKVDTPTNDFPQLNKLKYTKQMRPYSTQRGEFGSFKSKASKYIPKNTARKSFGGTIPTKYQVESHRDSSKSSIEAETEEADNREAIPKVIIKRLTKDKGDRKDEKKNHVLIIKNNSLGNASENADKDPCSLEDVEEEFLKMELIVESSESDQVIYAEPSNYNPDTPENDNQLEEFFHKPLKVGHQEFVEWLFALNLLPLTQFCVKHKDYYYKSCNFLMLQYLPDCEELALSGYYQWISHCCSNRVSIYNGSFFGAYKNPKFILALMNKWASMSRRRYKTKSLDVITKLNNYFRCICTIMIQEVAFNFGADNTVVELGAVIFEKTIKECNIQVEVLGIYDRKTGYYRFFVYQYSMKEEKFDVFTKMNYQKLINQRNATIVCDPSIEVDYLRQTYNKVLVCSAGETNQDSNDTIYKYLRNHVTKIMMNVMDLSLSLEEIQLLLNELSWREIYGKNKVESYMNMLKHIQEFSESESCNFEMLTILDHVMRNPDGSWAKLKVPASAWAATEYPQVYNTEIKIDENVIRRGISNRDSNTEILKKFRALAKIGCKLICDQINIKLHFGDSPAICIECGVRMGVFKHFASWYQCSLCTFASSCSNRLSYHYFAHDEICIDVPAPIVFERRKNPYIPLLENFFCKCGFVPETGNELATHLVRCEEGDQIAYSSLEGAFGSEDSDSEDETTVNPNSPQDTEQNQEIKTLNSQTDQLNLNIGDQNGSLQKIFSMHENTTRQITESVSEDPSNNSSINDNTSQDSDANISVNLGLYKKRKRMRRDLRIGQEMGRHYFDSDDSDSQDSLFLDEEVEVSPDIVNMLTVNYEQAITT